jgi:trehalose 6-phosphate synthase/trehalose 6-phosphate phosphatase
MPDEWLRSEWTTEFFGGLASAPVALLMLDYDGTLAPFTTDRLQAVPYPGVKARLEMLLALPRTRLVLISGRKAQELRDLLTLSQPIEIWGSHGREHLYLDGTYEMDALTPYEQSGLLRVQQALEQEFNADVIEVKPNSVAVHWRRALNGSGDDPRAIREKMEQLYADLPAGNSHDGILKLLAFDGGLELRAGTVNKGHAVTRIMEQFPPGTPAAFLGDDTTDEDAFAVLREGALAVLVRPERRPTLARAWLRPPDDLLHFLDAWIAAMKAPR